MRRRCASSRSRLSKKIRARLGVASCRSWEGEDHEIRRLRFLEDVPEPRPQVVHGRGLGRAHVRGDSGIRKVEPQAPAPARAVRVLGQLAHGRERRRPPRAPCGGAEGQEESGSVRGVGGDREGRRSARLRASRGSTASQGATYGRGVAPRAAGESRPPRRAARSRRGVTPGFYGPNVVRARACGRRRARPRARPRTTRRGVPSRSPPGRRRPA